MLYSICVLLFLFFSSSVLSRPQEPPGFFPNRPRPGPPLPTFLQDISEEARTSFYEIYNDWNMTMIEMKNQTEQWASKYGILDKLEEFEKNHTALENELDNNITSILSNLSTVQTSIDAIFRNKNQTRYQLNDAIIALEKEYPQEVETLLHLRHPHPPPHPPHDGGPPPPPPGGHGGPGGPGGPHDGHRPPPPSSEGIIGGIGGPRFTDDFSFLS